MRKVVLHVVLYYELPMILIGSVIGWKFLLAGVLEVVTATIIAIYIIVAMLRGK